MLRAQARVDPVPQRDLQVDQIAQPFDSAWWRRAHYLAVLHLPRTISVPRNYIPENLLIATRPFAGWSTPSASTINAILVVHRHNLFASRFGTSCELR